MRMILLLSVALSAGASAETPRRIEIGLDCAAAATVSTMVLRDTNAPPDMQDDTQTILAAATVILHNSAEGSGMTVEQMDEEVVRRSNVLVDRINSVPDEAYSDAVFTLISMEESGGMYPCAVLTKEAHEEGLL